MNSSMKLKEHVQDIIEFVEEDLEKLKSEGALQENLDIYCGALLVEKKTLERSYFQNEHFAIFSNEIDRLIKTYSSKERLEKIFRIVP